MSAPVIGAFLSQERMLRKVDKLLRGKAVLYAFPTWADLNAFAATSHLDAVFVDPMVESAANWKDRLLHLQSPSWQRVILYTVLTPESAAVLLAMGRCGVRAVVFSRVDDYPERLAEVLASTGVRVIYESCPY